MAVGTNIILNSIIIPYLCFVKKQGVIKSTLTYLLAMIVFFSSTGFVSVKHVCNMTGKELAFEKTCCCDNASDKQNFDNFEKASCCSVKTNYFVNAVVSFDPNTQKAFYLLPVLKYNRIDFSLFSNPFNEIIFSFDGKFPPLINGRIILLKTHLLLI